MVKLPMFCMVLILVFVVSGCEQIDKASLDEVIQKDPSFKPTLDKKQDLDSKIETMIGRLRDLKTDADSRIRAIQENFNKEKTDIDAKVTALKKELEPERFKIRENINTLRTELTAKKGMLRNLEATKRNLSNLITQKKAVNVTEKDASRWQEELTDLDKQIAAFLDEIKNLEEKIHILRIKLLALRQ
ncbi:MAG: hypothetical protein NTV07_06530 [Candidatus Omnitrophica bacterium]|nr:hypothetical protein [Candidatus Omnitrophota bacterium]